MLLRRISPRVVVALLVTLFNLNLLRVTLNNVCFVENPTKDVNSHTRIANVTTRDVEETRENPEKEFDRIFEERRSLVRQECSRMNRTQPMDFSKLTSFEWPWIYVSRKYKLLYCQVPKVGTTNWLKVLSVMEGMYNDSSDLASNKAHLVHFELLSYLKKAERAKVMSEYTKFMVVREPFERTLSAFRDKFVYKPELKGPMYRKLAASIVDRYRSNLTSDVGSSVRRLPKMPRFGEFVHFVVDPRNSEVDMHYSEPRHWMPQSELCYPCNIKYDYILHMDNIANESDVLLANLGVPPAVKYPKSTSKVSERDREVMKSSYYSAVRPEYVNLLYHYYALDYRLFGFSPPPQF